MRRWPRRQRERGTWRRHAPCEVARALESGGGKAVVVAIPFKALLSVANEDDVRGLCHVWRRGTRRACTPAVQLRKVRQRATVVHGQRREEHRGPNQCGDEAGSPSRRRERGKREEGKGEGGKRDRARREGGRREGGRARERSRRWLVLSGQKIERERHVREREGRALLLRPPLPSPASSSPSLSLSLSLSFSLSLPLPLALSQVYVFGYIAVLSIFYLLSHSSLLSRAAAAEERHVRTESSGARLDGKSFHLKKEGRY